MLYTLGAGAPACAKIDLSTGLFRWTPLPICASTTNLITVWVSDDATPRLSTQSTFKIVVFSESLLINDLAVAPDGGTLFRWSTLPGRLYQVEFKDTLNAADWIPAEAPRLGDGSVQTFSLDPSGAPQRFFRVVELAQ